MFPVFLGLTVSLSLSFFLPLLASPIHSNICSISFGYSSFNSSFSLSIRKTFFSTFSHHGHSPLRGTELSVQTCCVVTRKEGTGRERDRDRERGGESERERRIFLLQSDTQCQPDLLHSQQASTEAILCACQAYRHTFTHSPTHPHTRTQRDTHTQTLPWCIGKQPQRLYTHMPKYSAFESSC